jgi:hypothetical protein
MRTWLYLHQDFPLLAGRWLDEHSDASPVCLLHDAAGRARAQRLAAANPAIMQTVCLDDTEACASMGLEGVERPRVVLPISPDHIVLRYHAPVQQPAMQPFYPHFRRLWLAGFREFEVYSLSGARVMAVEHLLDAFAGVHQGRRCFVVGNGPSLNQVDMTKLRDEITLGSNRCYLGYEKWGGPFTYWGIYDKYQIQEYHHDYETQPPAHHGAFLPFEYLPFLRKDQVCPVNVVWPRRDSRMFSDSPEQVYVGHTVTYMLLQIAAIMGCNPIILVGVDHRYNLKHRYIASKSLRRLRRAITRRLRDTVVYDMVFAAQEARLKARARARELPPGALWEAAHARQATHFDARYTEGGRNRFLPPEPEEAERDFACAAKWARNHGVQILNATPDSALRVFPMVDFDGLF